MRAAWSPISTVRNNNYGLVKLFLSRWRLAEPLPLAACLVHLAAPATKGYQEARLAERRRAFGMRLFAAGEPLHSILRDCLLTIIRDFPTCEHRMRD